MKYLLLLFTSLISFLSFSQQESAGGYIYFQANESGKKFQIVECDSCIIERFVMNTVVSGKAVSLKSKSNLITTQMKHTMRQLQKGDTIYFDYIYYRNNENKIIRAPQHEVKL